MNNVSNVLLHCHALLWCPIRFGARNGSVAFEVKPGAERPTGSRQNNNPAVMIGMKGCKRVVESVDKIHSERVHVIWAVQRDERNSRCWLVEKNGVAHLQILAGSDDDSRFRQLVAGGVV
jgi:hypothetical protein